MQDSFHHIKPIWKKNKQQQKNWLNSFLYPCLHPIREKLCFVGKHIFFFNTFLQFLILWGLFYSSVNLQITNGNAKWFWFVSMHILSWLVEVPLIFLTHCGRNSFYVYLHIYFSTPNYKCVPLFFQLVVKSR